MNREQTIVLYQPLLHTIAYNLVRCKADAEDIVQETFVKWLSIDHEKIVNTKAYLIKAVTNNCMNHLNSLRRKKEEYLENMSEVFNRFKETTNLAHLDFEVNLTAALNVLHTKLEPLERAVFLLKEVFDFDYEDLQVTLNKKKDHCRQLVCRAKKKLGEETAKINFPDTSKIRESLSKAFHFGNPAELISDLKTDIDTSL
ncbi:MAG TPA: sigma-70 family RNA polymerase sigma factor [Ohtaekwangia sp.]|nr:sigma-70 family RNA polymerase sigma factor [Ohtaekwangia sp.]